jgi:hypothetical protein
MSGHDGRCGAIEDVKQFHKPRPGRSDSDQTAQSSIPRQLAPPPMRFLPQRVKLPFDMTVERPHHAYPGEHSRAAALNEQHRVYPLPPIKTINQLDCAGWP